MSWQAVRQVLEVSESRGAARLVLLVLAEHADEAGDWSYPSYDTICAEANIGRGTVRPALDRLLELGEIQRRGKRRSGTAVWCLSLRGSSTLELADGSTVELGALGSSSSSEGGSSRSADRSSRDSASSSTLEHEPSVEPSNESPLEPGGQDRELNGTDRGQSEPVPVFRAEQPGHREETLRSLRDQLASGSLRGPMRRHTEAAINALEDELACEAEVDRVADRVAIGA